MNAMERITAWSCTVHRRALGSLLLLTLLFSSSTCSQAETSNGIALPNFNDKYSAYVRKLESGKTDIDYRDFRNSFLESRQFEVKGEKQSQYDNLKKEVSAQIDQSNYQGVIKATKAMLSIDYTSMFAHKYLQQTYKILGDTVNRDKYHDIEFGLLKSITTNGDGKTCETAWHVVQIEEEYFILAMMGVDLKQQSLAHSNGNAYDKMDVTTNHGDKTYYFEINQIIAKTREALKITPSKKSD